MVVVVNNHQKTSVYGISLSLSLHVMSIFSLSAVFVVVH